MHKNYNLEVSFCEMQKKNGNSFYREMQCAIFANTCIRDKKLKMKCQAFMFERIAITHVDDKINFSG